MKVNRIFSGIVLSLCLISCVVRVVNKIDLNNYLITEFEDESDYTEGKYEPFTYRNYGDYIEISGYYKPKTDFVIPAEIDGLPVTSIGKEAFRWSSLTSVKIPDSVTNIGEMAFYSCDGLTSIEIPDSVTTIGGSAFSNCRNLTSLKIPNSVTNIGSLAFSDCKSLKSIIIPNSVTSIGSMAFNDCESLKSAIIPNSITSIEDWTFSGCESLTSVEMSDSITYIGSDAFDKTLWLEKKREENPLVIVNNLLIDGQNCAGDVVIPDGVTSIC
ncbi:MAG: leucine-rich repeat domain-containing protein, partial [Ruminococcus sp.]|nr:leucine-rich repeat domain-containing protein [Ruminococcus sp.]